MKANITDLSLTGFSNFCTNELHFRFPAISRKSNEVKYAHVMQTLKT